MMSDNNKQLFTKVTSIAASVMLARTIFNELIPHEFRTYFQCGLDYFSHRFSNQFTTIIDEYQGRVKNQVFEAAEIYLNSKARFTDERVKVSKYGDDKDLSFNVDRDEEIFDVFENIRVKWKRIKLPVESSRILINYVTELRSYELTFHKKHKEKIFASYLPYVMERSDAIKQENTEIKIYQAAGNPDPYKFNHPMTFKTLAIDAKLKEEILNDLDRFVKRKEFYKRTGKAWKRGYLLYGPPGTGKSSLIAAMANYLHYDIFDLDLTTMHRNSDLRDMLLNMSDRSILVIEDIDCSIHLPNRKEEEEEKEDYDYDDDDDEEEEGKEEEEEEEEREEEEEEEEEKPVDNGDNKITLSGLLNVIDGLWSCCREECIIVITTNHKERLDHALIRPGRIDMQIHLSYCTFSAFEQLVNNYLGISEHKLFEEVQELLREVQVTPAEIAEELIKIVDSKECLQDLVKFIRNKKMLK